MAVQYVVVPLAPAPDPYARDTTYVPSNLLAVLDGQLDLDSVTVNAGVRVYRNAAFGPSRALLPQGTVIPSGGDALTDRIIRGLRTAPAVLGDIHGYSDWSGSISKPGPLFVSAAGDGWHLNVDGAEVPSSRALGWANSYTVEQAGDATLRFDTPVTRWLALLGQVVLWVLVLGYLLRVRVRQDEGNDLSGPALVAAPPAPRHVVIGADLDDLFGTASSGDLPTMAVPVVGAPTASPSAEPTEPAESSTPRDPAGSATPVEPADADEPTATVRLDAPGHETASSDDRTGGEPPRRSRRGRSG
jgi:hypothetical protein